MAGAVRACSARRPRRLAARLNWAQAAGRPDEVVRRGDPSARVAALLRPACSSSRLDGRAEWRPTGRASGPRGADRARAGRCHGRRATGRPGRAGRRAGAARRAETPQGRYRARAATTIGGCSTIPELTRPCGRARPRGRRRSAGGSTPRPGGGSRPSGDPSLEPEAAAARARLAKAETPAAGGGTLADLLGPLRSPAGGKAAVTRQAERTHVRR